MFAVSIENGRVLGIAKYVNLGCMKTGLYSSDLHIPRRPCVSQYCETEAKNENDLEKPVTQRRLFSRRDGFTTRHVQ